MLERYKNPIFVVIILAIVGGGAALLTYRPAATVITIIPPPPTVTPVPSATPGPIIVYVTGAVVNSGKTYTLNPGSRIQDAITAAGGFTSDADTIHINLAQTVHDGDQINVSTVIQANPEASPVASSGTGGIVASDNPTTASTASTSTSKSSKTKATKDDPVHINTATLDDLQRLPGVGPSFAQKIFDYRTQHGPFKSMSDVSNVSGVGPSKIKEWDGLIVFD